MSEVFRPQGEIEAKKSEEEYLTDEVETFQKMFDDANAIEDKTPELIAHLKWITQRLGEYQQELLNLHRGEDNE